MKDFKAIYKNYKNLIKRKSKKAVGDRIRAFHYYVLWPKYYEKYSRKPVDPKKVVFAYSELYKRLPDNMRVMKKYLESKGFKCVEVTRAAGFRKSNNKFINLLYRIFDGEPYFKAAGDAGAIFLNDYYFPAFANQPRDGQKIIQLWHGCGAFKKWGYSTAEKKWGATKKDLDRFPVHNTYTHVCVSSPEVKFAYADAFGTGEENIYALGAPRTDIYFDPAFVRSGRQRLLEMYPEIGDRKIILYAPTFRGNKLRTSYIRNNLDLELMQQELGKDYVLVLKFHPLTAKAFKLSEEQKEILGDFVFNASKTVDIDTALCAADITVTDYSSLIFEYALLERPMIFYAYDLEDYEDARSFYYDYKSFVPSKVVYESADIITEVKRLEKDFDVQKVRDFKNKFMSACDGHSTEKIAKAVFGDLV